MCGAIFYLIVMAVVRRIKRKHAPVARGLCGGCSFAHIQHGARAKIATFCTFGGGIRTVALDVLFCTDYRDRNVTPRIVRIGFVREIGTAEVGIEVAKGVRREAAEAPLPK
jgi:hypothetical protein